MADEQEAPDAEVEPVEHVDIPMDGPQRISTEDAITNVDQACAAFGGNRQQHIFLQMSVNHLAERARHADALDAAQPALPPPNRATRRATKAPARKGRR